LAQTTPDEAPASNLTNHSLNYIIKLEQPNNKHNTTNTPPHYSKHNPKRIKNTNPTIKKEPSHNNKHNHQTITNTTPIQ